MNITDKNETGEQNADERNLEIKPGSGTDNRNPDKDDLQSQVKGPTGNPHNVDTDPNRGGDNRTEPNRPV